MNTKPASEQRKIPGSGHWSPAFEIDGLGPAERLLIGVVWRQSQMENGECSLKRENLGRRVGVKGRNVARAIQRCVDAGLIEDLRTPPQIKSHAPKLRLTQQFYDLFGEDKPDVHTGGRNVHVSVQVDESSMLGRTDHPGRVDESSTQDGRIIHSNRALEQSSEETQQQTAVVDPGSDEDEHPSQDTGLTDKSVKPYTREEIREYAENAENGIKTPAAFIKWALEHPDEVDLTPSKSGLSDDGTPDGTDLDAIDDHYSQ